MDSAAIKKKARKLEVRREKCEGIGEDLEGRESGADFIKTFYMQV